MGRLDDERSFHTAVGLFERALGCASGLWPQKPLSQRPNPLFGIYRGHAVTALDPGGLLYLDNISVADARQSRT